jgi:hypothetical protein
MMSRRLAHISLALAAGHAAVDTQFVTGFQMIMGRTRSQTRKLRLQAEAEEQQMSQEVEPASEEKSQIEARINEVSGVVEDPANDADESFEESSDRNRSEDGISSLADEDPKEDPKERGHVGRDASPVEEEGSPVEEEGSQAHDSEESISQRSAPQESSPPEEDGSTPEVQERESPQHDGSTPPEESENLGADSVTSGAATEKNGQKGKQIMIPLPQDAEQLRNEMPLLVRAALDRATKDDDIVPFVRACARNEETKEEVAKTLADVYLEARRVESWNADV